MPRTSPLDQIIPVALTIKPTTLKTIMEEASDRESSPSYELARLAQNLLEQIAQGGVMIDPSNVARIEAAIGEELEPEDLAERVEKSVNRRGAILSGMVEIDPSYEAPLKARAITRGTSVLEEVQEIINYSMDEGWPWEVENPPRLVRLTDSQYNFIRDLLQLTTFTGEDLCCWLQAGQKPPEKVSIFDEEEAS